ncbi:unnamed protein product, partial [marine sediment metagenome]
GLNSPLLQSAQVDAVTVVEAVVKCAPPLDTRAFVVRLKFVSRKLHDLNSARDEYASFRESR